MREPDSDRASIQRFSCPQGTDATRLADHYFDWLDSSVWIAHARRTDTGIELYLLGFGSPAIELSLTQRSTDRVVYEARGGWLVDGPNGGTFEFRTLADGRAQIALVGYAPSLPRWLYTITQAVVHDIVMRAYIRHLSECDRRLLTDSAPSDGGSS